MESTVNSCIMKLNQGKERKALKFLCSNGIAKINPETVRVIQELHPERKEELKLPRPTHPQLTVDPAFITKKLFQDASDCNLSKDLYGWAPWLFLANRGEKKGFFSSLTVFICFLADNPTLFPSVCSMLLSGGALTPLHKLSAIERKEREEAKLAPKLRPINSGTLIAKVVLSSVLASPAGQRAADKVAPFQLSLGTSRGVEKMIHVCRTAHESGWIIGKNDFENGFNRMSRQKMLDTHSVLFPEAVNIFNFFYGVDSPVYLIDDDLDIITLKSQEGPRQGCSAGTEAFCLGIHPVLSELQKKYPDFEFRVVTDDVVPLLPPPPIDSFECWQALYKRYAKCLRDLEELSRTLAGLSLNVHKSGMLLPITAPLPTQEVRDLFPAFFEFRQDGMRVAGSPIGTDEFMHEFVRLKVVESTAKLAAIKLVGKKSPRTAHRLLSSCATKLFSFLASTVPPHITVPALTMFDQDIESTFFSIISSTGIRCSRERFELARLKASLPPPFGCGLFKSADQAKIAWWSSVSACLTDPLLFKLRSGFTRFAESAFSMVIAMHGGVESKHWAQVKHLYPPNACGLLDGTLFSPGLPTTNVCKLALKIAAKQKLEHFQRLTSVSMISETLTPADVINSASRSFSGRIFSEPLKEKRLGYKFTDDSYIAFCRFFLQLPPTITIGEATTQAGFDYPVQRCQADHGVHVSPFLDASANHASSKCPSASLSVMQKHTNIINVLISVAKEAGLETRKEPDTYSLLLGEFSKKECQRVFPKRVDKAYRASFEALSQAVDLTSSVECTLTPEQKQSFIQTKIDKLPILAKDDAAGLRIDASLVNMETGETIWIDASVVHTSSPSYADHELKAITKRQLSTATANLHKLPDVLLGEPSPTLLKRQNQKVEKYARLTMIAKKQCTEGKRSNIPKFMPFVVSDCGELSPCANEVEDWIVDQYKRKLTKSGSRADGYTTSELVHKFRHKIKIGVQEAIAAGLGSMIQAAGRPWGGLGR
jgi:hypothetical protein